MIIYPKFDEAVGSTFYLDWELDHPDAEGPWMKFCAREPGRLEGGDLVYRMAMSGCTYDPRRDGMRSSSGWRRCVMRFNDGWIKKAWGGQRRRSASPIWPATSAA